MTDAMQAAWVVVDDADNGRTVWTSEALTISLARALLVREAEIQKLRDRLEIAHVWQMVDGTMTRVPAPEGEEIPDGIACRDETIRLQDRRIAELEDQVRTLKTAGDQS